MSFQYQSRPKTKKHMPEETLNILTLSGQDRGGGANEIARSLAEIYRARGHQSVMVVGEKRRTDPSVIELPDRTGGLAGIALALRDTIRPALGTIRGAGRLHEFFHCLGRPRRFIYRLSGREDWVLPACHDVLDLAQSMPDLIHGHNLHSYAGPRGHFDLSALPALCRKRPVVLTLHDAWLAAGHCAHSIDCGNWLSGCGNCPDLSLYPPIRRDQTAYNLSRKKEVFENSRLYIATPSRWLMDKVKRSILAPAIIEERVIAGGIDISVFSPGKQEKSRAALGLPVDRPILIFAAQGVKKGSWKDYGTMRSALAFAVRKLPDRNILFIALGDNSPPEKIDGAEIRFLTFQKDAALIAEYYRASDIYLHAARADTFPTTILEAMACGRPVVATAVGGISEQLTAKTGILTPPGDGEAMGRAITNLLGGEDRRRQMGDAARARAIENFNQETKADEYLAWFKDIVERLER